MKASVIIPTYNSCERLYLNLLSLNCQDCEPDSYEVIVVDNGSNDNTPGMISGFKAVYGLKYLKVRENQGRAYARNLGASNACGEILIFNDSDMINASDFINSHIKEHDKKNLIACGYGWRRIYSYYYRDFEGYLRNNFVRQMRNYRIRGRDFYKKDSVLLISEKEISDNEFLKYSFFLEDRHCKVREVVNSYGYDMERYCFPWRFFMTCNCSLEKELFTKSGGFDEKYDGWGYEDIDLGYRLYKRGSSFRLVPGCISVHQEHPIDAYDTCNDNLYYFLDKYNNIDLYLFYYGNICAGSNILNKIAAEAEKLEALGGYEDILLDFLNMLKTIRYNCIYVKNYNTNLDQKDLIKPERCADFKYFTAAYGALKRITSGVDKK